MPHLILYTCNRSHVQISYTEAAFQVLFSPQGRATLESGGVLCSRADPASPGGLQHDVTISEPAAILRAAQSQEKWHEQIRTDWHDGSLHRS